VAEIGHGRKGLFSAAVIAWLITALYYFTQYMMRSAPSVMMPELTAAFGISVVSLTSLLGLFYYGYAPFSLIAGVALDRLGPRRVVPIGAAAMALGALLFTLGDPALAAIGRFIQGAGGVFALPAFGAHVAIAIAGFAAGDPHAVEHAIATKPVVALDHVELGVRAGAHKHPIHPHGEFADDPQIARLHLFAHRAEVSFQVGTRDRTFCHHHRDLAPSLNRSVLEHLWARDAISISPSLHATHNASLLRGGQFGLGFLHRSVHQRSGELVWRPEEGEGDDGVAASPAIRLEV